MGGVEQVTSKVINETDYLEAIAFTGSGYTEFIPAYKEATQKGIAISAAVGGNAQALGEYTITLILAMLRRLPMMTAKGSLSFYTARGFRETTLGIVGFGHTGKKVAEIAKALGFKVIANKRNQNEGEENGIKFFPLNDLLNQSDVVSLHVNKIHGKNVIGKDELAMMKDESILINTAYNHAVDLQALHEEIYNKRLFSAFDTPPDIDFSDTPLGYFLASNSQTAFNTSECNKIISDRATNSLINLLSLGNDVDLVNPEYKNYLVCNLKII